MAVYLGTNMVNIQGGGSGSSAPTLQTKTKTYTPTTLQQTETVTADVGYDGLSSVGITVNAMPSGTAGTPTATKGTVSNHSISVTPSVTNITGYITGSTKTGTAVTVSASELVSGTLYCDEDGSWNVTNAETFVVDAGTVNNPTATKGTVTNHSVTVTPSVSHTQGWISSGTKTGTTVTVTASELVSGNKSIVAAGNSIDVTDYATVSVASGSATAPATVSGTAATVSTGTNTLTLTKTVSVTPTVSAGYISSGTAGNSSVSLTASVTTKAAATYHPSTTDQTISASQYLTGAQTIKAVTMTNLTAANIKKDVVVKIGDATDDDCVTTITGTYEGSSGGAGLTVDTSTTTLNSAATSISFTGLAGEPTSFAVVSATDLATGASPWKTAAVVFDGTDLHGQTIRNTSNAQVSYDGTAFSKTYSNGTLTITGSGTNFQANQYKLVYTYGGSDIGTADVQVGSGATTITFTGLSEEPSYFSCIFKSNFSTSSGYQRAIAVVYDGTSVYGLEMDSGAHYSDVHWSYTYNNGSLTITSQSTNAGGYFHQPGYYQLTYATEGESGNYQSKTVYATSSQQVVQADSGYDALKKVTIPAVTTTNLSASNILSGVTIQVGDAADSDRIASVTGNVVLQNYYTGSSAPSSSLGSNGDLYLQS